MSTGLLYYAFGIMNHLQTAPDLKRPVQVQIHALPAQGKAMGRAVGNCGGGLGGKGTAPGIMCRLERTNEFCISFDPTDRIDLEQHQPFFAGTAKEKYCTNCHGKHRLAKRRTKWK